MKILGKVRSTGKARLVGNFGHGQFALLEQLQSPLQPDKPD